MGLIIWLTSTGENLDVYAHSAEKVKSMNHEASLFPCRK